MKILIDVQDTKANHLIEILKSLPFVKTKTITNEKDILLSQIKESFKELELVKKGKLKGRPIKNLLDEI